MVIMQEKTVYSCWPIFTFIHLQDDLLSSTLNFGTIYHNKFINAEEKERVLISFFFQPNPPII